MITSTLQLPLSLLDPPWWWWWSSPSGALFHFWLTIDRRRDHISASSASKSRAGLFNLLFCISMSCLTNGHHTFLSKQSFGQSDQSDHRPPQCKLFYQPPHKWNSICQISFWISLCQFHQPPMSCGAPLFFLSELIESHAGWFTEVAKDLPLLSICCIFESAWVKAENETVMEDLRLRVPE